MRFELLSPANVDLYIRYLKKALSEEPDMMLASQIDETAIKKRLCDPFFQSKKSILAIENDEVVGRIEYHFYGCLQDGYRMAYVDWVYVLPENRHQGVAQQLFREFEKDCQNNSIEQYYLFRATNADADKFYYSFEISTIADEPVLRKNISEK